jgi:hypothetical protein
MMVTAEAKAAQEAAAKIAAIEPERDRRLALGFDYDFADERGVHRIGTTAGDMKGWDEVTKIANALINAGDTATTIHIETNTGGADVTAQEWNAILLYAGAVRQPVWQASFTIAAMDPLPEDVTADALWPTGTA